MRGACRAYGIPFNIRMRTWISGPAVSALRLFRIAIDDSMNIAPALEDRRFARAQTAASPGLLGDFTWTLIGNGIFSFCQWGIIIVLAKLVTTEAVGQYSLSQAILGPVLMFVAFGLRVAVASDLKDQFTNREYLGFRQFTLAIGVLVAVLLALATARSSTVVAMVAIMGLTQAAELTSDTLYGFHQRKDDLVRPATSIIMKSLIGLMVLTAGIYWGRSVLIGLAGLAGTRVAVLVLYDRRGVMSYPDPMRDAGVAFFHWRRHIQLFRVVFFLGLLALCSSLISAIPRYFVEYYRGARELGMFAAITSLTSIGQMPVAALGIAAFVRLAKAFTDAQPREILKILSVLLSLSFTIGIGGVTAAYFWGPRILTLLFRREYSGQVGLLLLTMIMGAVTFLSASLGVSLSAARIFKRQTTLLAVVGVFEALACWILVPLMGLTGAAIACLAGAVVQLCGTAYILVTHMTRHTTTKAVTITAG